MLACALALMAAPALAADDPVGGGLVDLTADQWRQMVQGRTVTYLIGEERWANERYDPVGNGVSIQLADGTCMDGFWYMSEALFCFAWAMADTSCFRHVSDGDVILVIPTVDGLTSGTIQSVAGISDTALNCSGDLTS